MSEDFPHPVPIEEPDRQGETPSAAIPESEASAGTPDAPTIADGVDHRVDAASITVDRIGNGIRTVFLGGMLFVATLISLFFSGAPFWVKLAGFGGWGLFVLLLAGHAVGWPVLSYRHTSYRVTEQFFRFRTGVLWRSVISVPTSRVQHTDVSQGPIERQFGLATLIVHTAGTEHASVSLDGLAHQTALSIRDHLIGGGDDDAV